MEQSLRLFALLILLTFISCINHSGNDSSSNDASIEQTTNQIETEGKSVDDKIRTSTSMTRGGVPVRINHHINTSANEYLPVWDEKRQLIYFSGMDRTGYFDFKIDFTKARSSGGEDIFFADLKDGVFDDARPLTRLNTIGHESISQVNEKGDFYVTANYPEKLGPKDDDAGTETTDIFYIRSAGNDYQIVHLDEPVNSIYDEADAVGDVDQTYILFVSDRPGHVGDYHKKGWLFNGSFWGNTDVYVSVKDGDMWTVPVNLGKKVNSPGAERTPWLSADGTKLFISSNGYASGKEDLDIYMFTRTNTNDWENWDGPVRLDNVCSDLDDWGYKEYSTGAWFARALPLGFKPTQGGRAGDGGIRETNFRTGYTVTGAQLASLKADNNTDIYFVPGDNLPAFTLPEILFKFDSYELNPQYYPVLDRLVDLFNQNVSNSFRIEGHTDNIGSFEYNQDLSNKRANSLRDYLVSKGVRNKIIVKGFDKTRPLNTNSNAKQRALNRRIEIYIE
jgi:outer membrane protein OmpA-like peptidoglycan-associated protein